MYFSQKLQNIGRYTSVILAQISQKYPIFVHHFSVNLIFFSEKYTTCRYPSVILVQQSRKYLLFGHNYIVNSRYFFKNIQNIGRHIIVIFVQNKSKVPDY